MIAFRVWLLAGAALVTMTGPALAQQTPTKPAETKPAEAAKEEDTTVEDVVVSTSPSEVRASIDSTSYSLTNDLQASSGTLADALRNVPSVDVDPEGNVSLRGDPNVTILVDGRPSGMLTGDNRGQALLQLPASQYSRIEVMTNPSAAYSPEGGAVINLITKPNAPKPGQSTTGSIRANVSDRGRFNVGASGSFSKDKLTVSGDLGFRRDLAEQEGDRTRERLDPLTGDVLSTIRQTQRIIGDVDVFYGRFTGEYRLTDKLSFTGELRGNQIDNGGEGIETYETLDALGTPVSAYVRDGAFSFRGANRGVTGRLLQRYGEGHEWTNELRFDRITGHFSLASEYDYSLPVAPPLYDRLDNRNRLNLWGFTSGYTRPMPDDGKLRAGYELEVRDAAFDNGVRRGPTPTTLVVDPTVTNKFEVEQAVHALYGTYERPFGKFSAQVGLRLEYLERDLNQVTTGISDSTDDFSAYPTLHVGYQITDAQQIKASYSRRIVRPQPFLLNPFTTYQDPLNQRSGNPDLEPQETDAFELLWQLRAGQTFYQVTAYYRDTDGAFTDVTTDIGGGVLLTRPENLGSRRDLGVELVANGKLHETLRYNASLNLFRQEIDAAGLPGGRDRSGTVVSGRASLSWQPTPEDFIQLSGFWQGESLTAQGTREAGGMLNLGYRRKLSDKWAFQVTARDLLDDFGDVTDVETATYIDRNERQFGGRAVFIGLTYTFGASPKRPQDPQFDFSAPQAGN